ncbi:MAG: hypothetical protein TU35_001230 [Thermoproteus sp. AZ2]|jgi:predicted alpha/beta-fold hydrolase|uniref:Uncharacterized protein n=1 Tax=Thermoproteus sp. AZ2 TaxID=1609232 RepID=A0ACC6UYX8_9CREN
MGVVRDEGLIKYLRDDVPARVSGLLKNDDFRFVLRGLADLCVEVLNRSCSALGVSCGGDALSNAWFVMEKVVDLSNEFVLARYMAVVVSVDFIASRGGSLIVDMLVRDLLTCVEKVRVIILKMVEEGKAWVEIFRQ